MFRYEGKLFWMDFVSEFVLHVSEDVIRRFWIGRRIERLVGSLWSLPGLKIEINTAFFPDK